MICPTDWRGESDPYGSWKTICISRRKGRSARDDVAWISWPANSMVPVLAWSRKRARPSVVLPEPLSPTTPTVCPSRMASDTPSTALIWPTVRRRRPDLIGNHTRRSRAATRTGAPGSATIGAPDGSAASSRRV